MQPFAGSPAVRFAEEGTSPSPWEDMGTNMSFNINTEEEPPAARNVRPTEQGSFHWTRETIGGARNPAMPGPLVHGSSSGNDMDMELMDSGADPKLAMGFALFAAVGTLSTFLEHKVLGCIFVTCLIMQGVAVLMARRILAIDEGHQQMRIVAGCRQPIRLPGAFCTRRFGLGALGRELLLL